MEIKFIDLFSGIGGFHKAAVRALNSDKNRAVCVLASEIDEKAKEVYQYNYSIASDKIKNIREIKSSEIPDHDFLFAGFPCQTFSNAGKRLGFLDEIRGTLFFEIARILKEKKPNFFILENVKHLVNHNKGETFSVILNTIKELGYVTTEKKLIISAEKVGVPQKRERVYILGVRKELVDTKYLKNPELKNPNQKEMKILENKYEERYILSDEKIIRAINAWGEFLKKIVKKENRTLPPIWFDEMTMPKEKRDEALIGIKDWRKKYLLDMWDIYDRNKDFIDKWSRIHQVDKFAKREKKFEWQAGIDNVNIEDSIIQLRQSGIRCKKTDSFQTLVAIVQVPLVFDKKCHQWRYLNTKEVGKLQSFYSDDDHKKFVDYASIKRDGTFRSDYITYKQFGNSVNVEVVKQLIEHLWENYGKK
ncbi:DNA (cytosine-5-)-methyltransferase [Mesoplasma florum]|uniref:DNA (cytosine-5-)-methyltransferase n=1 Tax=Mesoplasma florum TaxID=2151 RepID=UPI000D086D22|nr:DNA (cytosine-5-)-methyltransferase [Mesoplasma florum]AVN60985.1 DNA (cytosine-5-)-methyltransferase [Mesoplasma florum]